MVWCVVVLTATVACPKSEVVPRSKKRNGNKRRLKPEKICCIGKYQAIRFVLFDTFRYRSVTKFSTIRSVKLIDKILKNEII